MNSIKGSSISGSVIVSGIIVLAASVFLLAYDRNLMKYGMLHWYALIAYVIIVAILMAIAAARKKGAYIGLIIIPIVFIILILIDAAFNLPLSNFYSPHSAELGWRYLFGFGYGGDNSTAVRSAALVIDLIASAVLAGVSIASFRRR